MGRAAAAGALLPGEGPQGAVECAAAALQEEALGTREALGGARVARPTVAVAGCAGLCGCLEESSARGERERERERERAGVRIHVSDPVLRSHVVGVQDIIVCMVWCVIDVGDLLRVHLDSSYPPPHTSLIA